MNASQRTCANHEGAPAIAVCSDCDGDICGECHGVNLRGFAVCLECRRQYLPLGIPWESGATQTTLQGFGQTTIAVLMNPRTFFGRMNPDRQSWGLAAGFGIICVAAGTLINTMWQKTFSAEYTENLALFQDELGLASEIVELMLFASIPFGAVFLYFLHTMLFFLALRAFRITEATWPLVARISGYSLAAYLLLVFPPMGEFGLGHFLMVLWLFNLEVSAVRWFFGLGFWRSMGVVLVPFMLFLFVGG